jgi:hypothetical protein
MVIFFRQVTVTRTKVGNVESASGGMSQVGQSKDPNLAQFLEHHQALFGLAQPRLKLFIQLSTSSPVLFELSHLA